MRLYRFLPLLLTVGALVLLTGALKRPAGNAPPEPTLEDGLEGAAADANAELALDEAIAALSLGRADWLATDVWQKVRLPDFEYEATGSYVRAPHDRFRLELRAKPRGGNEGVVLLVSDGTTLWEAERAGGSTWEEVSRLRLADVLARGGAGAPGHDDLLRGPKFTGVVPLLRNLRERMRWVRREPLSDSEVRLSGAWPAAKLAALVPEGEPWPEGLPRRCRLVLDARTSWPRRVEWWGPTAPDGPNVQLAEMELRAPVIGQPMPEDVAARTFSFDPGTVPVTDLTSRAGRKIGARAQHFAGVR
jgi:hypothetical protein